MPSPTDDAVQSKPTPSSLSAGIALDVGNSKFAEETGEDVSQPLTERSSIRPPSPPNAASQPTKLALAERVSRSVSPHGRLSRSLSRIGRQSVGSPLGSPTNTYDDIRSLIVRHFSPAVAVYASPDTDELVSNKGFTGGLQELIRPFGERVTGKVVVRDSVGSSRAWDDFAIRFTKLEDCVGSAAGRADPRTSPSFGELEEVLERHLDFPDIEPHVADSDGFGDGTASSFSPSFRLFLSRLLSAGTFSPHETFLHPVACVIAISSRNDAPIEALRQLYAQTAQGNKVLPAFANPEYLRYYVLIHDEDQGDIATSSALFDQMKRHFGLHCHLLHLRSKKCIPGEGDGVKFPTCQWLSPTEDLVELNDANSFTEEGTRWQLFDSDVVAINSFIRELAAQSVVPHMEYRIAQWNDQIASRRRGLSGRFMSISKKWTGFGTSTIRNMSSQTGSSSVSSTNYDSLQGIYHWDMPEAMLRKLADYAFLLRDYKLAASTYEMLRADYGNDQAWRYHAGANEMCAISHLLNPLAAAAKIRLETFDQMLEAASYSYLTRCVDYSSGLRCMALGVELLKVRGKTAASLAAKWAIRILELGLVGAVGHALVSERVASCFAAQVGPHRPRKRKAGLWSILAAEEWLKLGKTELASQQLNDASGFYANENRGTQVSDSAFEEMTRFLEQLHLAVRMKTEAAASSRSRGVSNASPETSFDKNQINGSIEQLQEAGEEEGNEVTEESSERLDERKTNRRSLLVGGSGADSLDSGPLSPIRLSRGREAPGRKEDDDFE